MNPTYQYAAFQQEQMVPALERVESGECRKLMNLLPFGHAKSDLGSCNFIPWYMGRNPHKSVILICYGADLSNDFGDRIRNQIASEYHQAIFPACKLSPSSRAKDFFRSTSNGAFYGVPFDGAVNGKRADLIVIDDPLKNIHEALSESREEHLISMYRGVIKNRLKPGGAIVMNTTRFAIRDFVARVLEEEGELWDVLRLQAEPDPENHPGVYLWEHWPKEKYEEAKRDRYTWAANFQQEPITTTDQRFDINWIMPDENGNGGCLYREPVPPGKWNTYMFCDPSLAREGAGFNKSDRTSILVLAAGPEKRLFLVDAVLDRLDPGQRTAEILRLHRVWKPKQFLYEEYGMQADTYHLKLEMEKQDLRIYPIPIGRKGPRHQMSKEARIWELVPDFREGRIWIPPTMKRKCKDGSTMDIIKYLIECEYLPYAGRGSVAHDDMLDCLSRIHEPEFHPDHVQVADTDDDEGGDYASGGSFWST